MRKLLNGLTLIAFLFISSVPVSSARKHWIYFKDKGIAPSANLAKMVSSTLSERAVRRRVLRADPGHVFDISDLPVYRPYLDSLKTLGVQIQQRSRWLNAVSVIMSSSQRQIVQNLPFVKKITPVMTFIRPQVPESAKEEMGVKKGTSVSGHMYDYGSALEQLQLIQVPVLHDLGYSGTGVLITLIDSGFHYQEHRAFQHLQVVAEWDFINHDGVTENEPEQDSKGQHNHGTEVLSLVGGFSPGEMIGVAFGATFALAKTEYVPTETRIEEDNWVAGIEWADSLGTDIVSTSLGYLDFDDGFSYTYQDLDGKTMVTSIAARKAVEKGIVVVAAAGNQGNDEHWPYVISPAEGIGVIAVGAVNAVGDRVSFSSIGPTADGRIKPDVMAMGSGNAVAHPNRETGVVYGSGTSFAAPQVAGVCALLLEMQPALTPDKVYQALTFTASRADSPDNYYGWGVVDALAAAKQVAPGEMKSKLPQAFQVHAPRIDPANGLTWFMLDVPETDFVTLVIYNTLGQKIAQQVSWQFAGSGKPWLWRWPMTLASGIYFARLEYRHTVQAQKFIIYR